MNDQIKKALDRNPLLRRYMDGIHEDVWELFLPKDQDEWPSLATAVIALRLVEEERRYVISLQHKYDLPLRPNESVKSTMIRVRIRRLRRRKRSNDNLPPPDAGGLMPIDPLE